MTAAELLEGDNTVDPTRLEELHALLDEFHREQAHRLTHARGGDGIATIEVTA